MILVLYVICETIKEFWKSVIGLINVNFNNNRCRYVENDVILGCLNKDLNMKREIFFYLKCDMDSLKKKILYES